MGNRIKLVAVVAMGENRVIGLEGEIPWSLADEHQHYIEIVKDGLVLMGRRNFELHGGMPPGRDHLILSRIITGDKYVASLDEAIDKGRALGVEELFILGGGEVYALCLDQLDEIHLSIVDYSGPGDSYFPELDWSRWVTKKETTNVGWTYRHLVKTSS